MIGMAAREPFRREPSSFECAVFGKRLTGVFRAGRIKAARRRQQRREEFLINANQKKQQRFHETINTIRLQKKLATKREPQRKKFLFSCGSLFVAGSIYFYRHVAHFVAQVVELRLQNIFMPDEHQLRRCEKIFFFQTKRFAQQAFDAIAFNCGANAFRRRESNPPLRAVAESDVEPPASLKTPVLKNRRDVFRATDDFVFGETVLLNALIHRAIILKKKKRQTRQKDRQNNFTTKSFMAKTTTGKGIPFVFLSFCQFCFYLSSLTVRRLRPLARRRASTVRPSFVRILSRKPCVALRLRLCG